MKRTESNEFAMRLIPSALSILLCLGLLCTTSWAYFTDSVSSLGNTITSAFRKTKVVLLNIQQPSSNYFNLKPPGFTEENTGSYNSIVPENDTVLDEYGNVVIDAGGGNDVAILAEGIRETVTSQVNRSFEDDIAADDDMSWEAEEEEIEPTDSGEDAFIAEIVGPYTCEVEGTCLYTFSVTADGNAENGYCEIRVGEDIYYTVQIPLKETIVVHIVAEQGTEIEFTAQIGTFSGYAATLMSLDDEETDDGLIGDGEVIERYPGQVDELFGESEGEKYDDVTDGGDLDDFDSIQNDILSTPIVNDTFNGGDLDQFNNGDLDDQVVQGDQGNQDDQDDQGDQSNQDDQNDQGDQDNKGDQSGQGDQDDQDDQDDYIPTVDAGM